MFDKMNIKTLIIVSFGVTIAFFLVVGGLGLYGLNQTNMSLKTVYEDRTVPVSQLSDIRVLMM
jgi:methyl-accepting chemotaxis protein